VGGIIINQENKKMEKINTELSGKRIIVRDNDFNTPLRLGTFNFMMSIEGDDGISKYLPNITINGEELISFSIIIPYTDEIWDLLNSMEPKKQYEILSGISIAVQTTTKFNRKNYV
jgi:hypothetical protein